MSFVLLAVMFVLGAIVGSFLNVAIARLPFEKSLLWPSSRCGSCYRPIRWFDNIPLLSYLWLRGRCRTCGASYSMGYFWIEMGTGVGFAALFYFEVIRNVHGWPTRGLPAVLGYPYWMWIGFAFHAVLFSFLMVASICDIKSREIPLRLTLTGSVVGLIGATLLPWPWPNSVESAAPREWAMPVGRILQGVQAVPFWGPLPDGFAPGDNWQTGLATGLAGLLVGTLLLRSIAFTFGTALGKEALGLGDADLMMMAGTFLGWQVTVVGFFLSIPFAFVVGLLNIIFKSDNSLPFGPSLSVGLLLASLNWTQLGQTSQFRFLFYNGTMLTVVVVASLAILVVSGLFLRRMRRE